MTIPEQIRQLVQRFEEHRKAYTSGSYKEAQARQDFINPFFTMLGWDMDNKQGYAEAYREVVHEDALKIGGHIKAPDYAFRIGGRTKFFLEAKKPSVRVRDEIAPAFQLRRYAWTANLPLSILTDFEEFAVYDCRIKPEKTDPASKARVMFFELTDYESAWDEIAAIFSKEAILTGSFDKYAESTKRKRGTTEVDQVFLREIEDWRQILARNIALRNKNLTRRELNFVVQRTIDRIIFLRICEDRRIEKYGRLQGLVNRRGMYAKLCGLFKEADDRYNSGLFHFRKEKAREQAPDELTLKVTIDDKPLQDIIKGLYYPDSPYEFSVLPADILGHVYEQFLGKVIHLTRGHQAKVEDKPEVRKAGGVVYTPTFIVDHIVEKTIGPLLEGKKPGPRGGISKLRILDPACGSGSFLIGAYQFVLNWHRDKYIEDGPEKHKKVLFQVAEGDWRLTTEEKKRILLNNIYGVDIDPQAVEVTKLSLLLKVLEGETEETIRKQLKLFQERALPDLGNNIKCGNSLIGPEVYLRQQQLFGEDENLRINAFEWTDEFPGVLKAGGFDAVIGNPPYIRIQVMKEWAPLEVEFYKDHYKSASTGNYDIYLVFVEKGIELLKGGGRLGFILPHKFFNANYGENLRKVLAEGRHLEEVVHFGDEQVFDGPSTYTCLLFLTKKRNDTFHYVKAHDLSGWKLGEAQPEGDVAAGKATAEAWNFVVGPGAGLFERLSKIQPTLEKATTRIFQGLKTGADPVYIVERRKSEKGKIRVYSKAGGAEYLLEQKLLHPLIKGGDSKRFSIKTTERLVLFPYKKIAGMATLIPAKEMRKQYPLTWSYLSKHKRNLEKRDRGKLKGPAWYGYSRNQALDVMPLPKLFTPDIADRAALSFDSKGDLFFTGGVAGGYGILPAAGYSHSFLLGLLNSKLLEWYLRQIATPMRGGYYSYEARYIRRLPIAKANKREHEKIEGLANKLVELKADLIRGRTPHAKEVLKRQIVGAERKLDEVVYKLYGLSKDEITIVEDEIS